MAKLIFLTVAHGIESGTYVLYDGTFGTGVMLTVEETLQQLAMPEPASELCGECDQANAGSPRATVRGGRPKFTGYRFETMPLGGVWLIVFSPR